MDGLALVTGGSGFLGRHIVEQLLLRGVQVRVLARRDDAELAAWGVEQSPGDLRDREAVIAACRNAEVVYHTAGIAGIWGPWRDYYEVNTLGTEHVLSGCRTHGVDRLVYTSTPSVTFDGAAQEGIDESAPYARRWLCNYQRSKCAAEQCVLSANGVSGLKTCSLRPHLIWGPGDRHLIPRLISRARRGKLRRVGDGTNRVDMVYVENAATAHLLAADALAAGSAGGQAYFVSQGEPVNCWQWIGEILALARLPAVRRWVSVKTAWRLGAALELAYGALRLPGEPPLTRFLAAQLGRSHYFDIGRARRELGYAPRISTQEGMARLGVALANQGD